MNMNFPSPLAGSKPVHPVWDQATKSSLLLRKEAPGPRQMGEAYQLSVHTSSKNTAYFDWIGRTTEREKKISICACESDVMRNGCYTMRARQLRNSLPRQGQPHHATHMFLLQTPFGLEDAGCGFSRCVYRCDGALGE